MSAHTRILIGLVAGAAAGVVTNVLTGGGEATRAFVSLVTEPVGRMWLSALIMVVIPLIVSSLSLGVAGLGDLRTLGRVGAVTLMSFLVLTTLSTALGIAAMEIVEPGRDLDPAIQSQLMEAYRGQARDAAGLSTGKLGIDLLVNIIPRNPVKAAADGDMVAVIFFALMLGIGMAMLPRDKSAPLSAFLDSLGAVTVAIIELVMKLAPFGVFCLIFSVTARFGFSLLVNLAQFVVTVVAAMALFQFVAYPLVLRFVAHFPVREFFTKSKVVMLTAFSTSSSNATLPTTLRVAIDDLKLPREVSSFVLPLGATMNMNGTALFEGATVLFLAQVFGVPLPLSSQVVVVLMAVVTSIGVAGVPGASIPLLMMILAMLGIPPEGIAIVLGVDRLLDMCRTVPNVTGDLVTAAIVARFERAKR